MKKILSLTLVLLVLFGSTALANTTLNFLEVMTSPERTALLKSMIAEYESLNPGVKINLISPPYEQSDQKATLMLNTNQPLDIIEVRDYTIKQFVNNKKLKDLSSDYDNWKHANTLTAVATAAAKTVDDTFYIVPQSIFIKALFVRTDVLASLGIDWLPETLEELVEICAEITDPTKNQFGFAWRGKSGEIKFSDLYAVPYVEAFKYDDTEYVYSEEETYFLDPGFKEGMELYLRLFNEGSPPDGVNWGFNEQINGFVSGVTPFLIQDPDAIPLIDNLLDPAKYDVITLPLSPYGYNYIDYGFVGLGIPSYSNHQEQAWDFIEWISSPEKNGIYNQAYGPLPVHTATFETSEYFQGKHYAAYNYEMNNPDIYMFKTYPLASEKWPGWSKIHETDMQSVLLGKMSLDEVLQKWEDYWVK